MHGMQGMSVEEELINLAMQCSMFSWVLIWAWVLIWHFYLFGGSVAVARNLTLMSM